MSTASAENTIGVSDSAFFVMANFSSRPALTRLARKHPSLFGVPFLLIMVGASYGLTIFTQARYDLHDQKVKNVSTENSMLSPSTRIRRSSSRCRRNKNWNWRTIGKNLTFGRNTLFVFYCFRDTSHWLLLLASKCANKWRMGTQAYPTSKRRSRVGRTTDRTHRIRRMIPFCNLWQSPVSFKHICIFNAAMVYYVSFVFLHGFGRRP